MNGASNVKKFGPAPRGPGEGSKGQISFNFNYKVNFKDFLFKTLCVFSQRKDTKHIRRDFHNRAWVMPQGWDLGALGVPRWSKKVIFKHGHVEFQIDEDDEQNRMQFKFLS